jgi:hypothetical protein
LSIKRASSCRRVTCKQKKRGKFVAEKPQKCSPATLAATSRLAGNSSHYLSEGFE